MAKPALTRSATLHLRINAFGALFALFMASFEEPVIAFTMALIATLVLALV